MKVLGSIPSVGVKDVDYSLYPSPELQIDWLTHYLKSLKVSGGTREPSVSPDEVQRLYVEVCKFSLVRRRPQGALLRPSVIIVHRNDSVHPNTDENLSLSVNYMSSMCILLRETQTVETNSLCV